MQSPRIAHSGANLKTIKRDSKHGLVLIGMLNSLLILGCDSRRVAEVKVAATDTIVVNHRQPAQLPAQALDSLGRVISGADVRWRWIAGDSLALSADGIARCERKSDATVAASSESIEKRVVVLCRPIRSFQSVPELQVYVGEPAKSFELSAIGTDGTSESLWGGEATISDTTIAALNGRLVSARARGETSIMLWTGECEIALDISALEHVNAPDDLQSNQIFEQHLTLVPQEIRSFRINAGHYVIDFAKPVQGNSALSVLGANCATFRGAPNKYSCLVHKSAVLAIQNPTASNRAPSETVSLLVRRLNARPVAFSSTSRRRNPYEKSSRPRCLVENP